LKKNEPMLLHIGTSDPCLGKGVKRSTLGSGGQRSRSHDVVARLCCRQFFMVASFNERLALLAAYLWWINMCVAVAASVAS